MAISKNSKMLQVALPKDVHDAMDQVCELLSSRSKHKITKRTLIIMMLYAFVESLEKSQIEEAKKEEN